MVRNSKNYQELPIGHFILCVPDELTYAVATGAIKDIVKELSAVSEPNSIRDQSTTARKVRTIRKQLKENQKTFGLRFGVSQTLVCRWETGRTAVPENVKRFLNNQGKLRTEPAPWLR